MPRTRKVTKKRAEAAKKRNELADQLAAQVKQRAKKPATRKGPTRAGVKRLLTQVNSMRERDDWSKARPTHLVALYTWCHEQVYEVEATEMVGLNWLAAASAAAKMVREEFGGSVLEGVEFLRWTWKREKHREEWRRENEREGGRITWRAQFQQRYLLTDYRIDRARQPTRG